MVVMIVSKDDFLHVAEVKVQVVEIGKDRLGTSAVSTRIRWPSLSTRAANPHSPMPSSASMVERMVTLRVFAAVLGSGLCTEMGCQNPAQARDQGKHQRSISPAGIVALSSGFYLSSRWTRRARRRLGGREEQ